MWFWMGKDWFVCRSPCKRHLPPAANAAPFVTGLGSYAPLAGNGLNHLNLADNRPATPPADGLLPVTVQLNDPAGSPFDYNFLRAVSVITP